MKRHRRLLVGVAILLLLLSLAGIAAAGPSAAQLPAHVHPMVARQVQASPSELVSVIVSHQPGARPAGHAARLGATVTARWSFINAFALRLPAAKVSQVARLHGVRAVLPDSTVRSTSGGLGTQGGSAVNDNWLLNTYNYAVRAPNVWSKGYKGRNVTVAVVDSGISSGSTTTDFGDRIKASVKMHEKATTTADQFGHGSHVAGIINGDGSSSKGRYIGIAPGANLINVKFSDDYGNATEKDLVSALQWVYEHRNEYNIRVVNLSSVVDGVQSYKESPVAAAVEQLWFAGVTVVASAGNYGTADCSTCRAPGNDPYVITVGAMDDNNTKQLTDDFVKSWSSYGTTLDGHHKPEIVAPGAHLVSYMPAGTLKAVNPQNVVQNNYFQMGGTSMAAPIVTGVIALLLEVNPTLTPDEIKWLIMNSARPYSGQPVGTAGIVDAIGAVTSASSPGKANQGLTPSPLLDPTTDSINWNNTYWSNTYWSNTYWSNTYWSYSTSY